MTTSMFVAWIAKNETAIPRSVLLEIKREGRARLMERLGSGYADAPLDFSDLIDRGESAICR